MSKKLILVVLIIIIAGGVWYKTKGSKQAAANAQKRPAVLVDTAILERKNIPLQYKTSATIVANESVAVRSRIDSQIVEVKFKDGDYVTKGQTLFVLDDAEIKAQLNEKQSNLARDNAQAENLKQQYNRNQELVKNGFVAAAELEDSKAAYDAQAASVKAAAAALQNLKVQLEYTKITAPISGRTGTINITSGNNVKANDTTPLVTINQVKPIRAQFSLPQSYISQVRESMKNGTISVKIKTDASKDYITGKLEYIDNEIDKQTNNFTAKAIFENADEALWPGMFVNIEVELGEVQNALTLPEVAVQRGQQGDYVYLIKDNTAKKTNIKTKLTSNAIAVIDEAEQNILKEGDVVAVDGILSLNDGAAITLKNAQNTPTQK
jgi:multidrug efflux system membrane fusion protein